MGGRQVGLLEPNWVHQDQPTAQEWPLRRPAGTTEFQLRLLAKHLAPDHTCTVCVQGLSMSPVTRNPVDLTHGRSIRSRKRQPFESGVFYQLAASTAHAVPSCNSPAPLMCPAGVRNDGRTARCKENGHTCAGNMPWNGLQSYSWEQVNFCPRRFASKFGQICIYVQPDLQSAAPTRRGRSSASGSKSHRAALYCLRPTPLTASVCGLAGFAIRQLTVAVID